VGVKTSEYIAADWLKLPVSLIIFNWSVLPEITMELVIKIPDLTISLDKRLTLLVFSRSLAFTLIMSATANGGKGNIFW